MQNDLFVIAVKNSTYGIEAMSSKGTTSDPILSEVKRE